MAVVKRYTKDRPGWKKGDTESKPLHPALEAFSQLIAEILVDRYLHRKATRNKGNDEASE